MTLQADIWTVYWGQNGPNGMVWAPCGPAFRVPPRLFRQFLDGVLRSSQARCSDKFAPRSRKVAEKTFISPKFIADSLPPIIVRHEKARNTERRAKATKAADTWVERIIASIPVAVDESIQS